MDVARKFFFFEVENALYCLEIGVVNRVIPAVEIAQMPDSPPYILGVLNLENEIIYVVDLRLKLANISTKYDIQHYLLLCKENHLHFALVIDKPLSIEAVPDKDIKRLKNNKNDPSAPQITYYKESPCPILALDQLISEDELLFFKQKNKSNE